MPNRRKLSTPKRVAEESEYMRWLEARVLAHEALARREANVLKLKEGKNDGN